jgi:hypothetical protein
MQYIPVTVNNANIKLTGNNIKISIPRNNAKIKLTGNNKININHKKQIGKLQELPITRNKGQYKTYQLQGTIEEITIKNQYNNTTNREQLKKN